MAKPGWDIFVFFSSPPSPRHFPCSLFCFTFEPCCVECSPINDKSELPALVLGNFKSNPIFNRMEHLTQVIPSEGFFFRERKMVDGCFRQRG